MQSVRLVSVLCLILLAGCRYDGAYLGRYPGWEKDLNIYNLPPSLAAQTCFLAGAEFEKQNNFEEANRFFEQTYALDPLFPGVLDRMARLSDKLGNPERAGELHRQVCLARPFDAAAHLEAGRFFARNSLADEALQHLQESARLAPERREVWDDLGKALANQNRTSDAVLAMTRIYPEDEARLRVGLVLFDSGRRAEGREIIAAAVSADPSLAKLARGISTREPKRPSAREDEIRTVGYEEP